MTEKSHMRANLVRAARAYADLQERERAAVFHRRPVSQCSPAGTQSRRHARPVPWIPRDRLFNTARPFEPALGQRQVNLLDFTGRKLRGEIPMRGIGFRNEQNAAGETVESVHDPGPQVPPDRR